MSSTSATKKALRSLALKGLKALAFDIRVHHDGWRIKLSSFRQKGYWWRGRMHEFSTMQSLPKIVHAKNSVNFDAFELSARAEN